MDQASTAVSSRATAELRPEALISGREHIFLATLAIVSGLSTLPLYRIIGDAFAHRIRAEDPLTSSRLLGFYLYVTIITIVVRYGEAILGLWAAKRSELTPLPVIDAPPDRSEYALGRLTQGVALGLLCAFLAVFINGTQFFIYGTGPSRVASATRLSRHNRALQQMNRLATWRSAFLLYVGAPIAEEIECRLLLFSMVVWLGRWLAKRYERLTNGMIMWSAVVLSGLFFGLLHVTGGQGVTWWRPLYEQVLVDARTYVGLVLAWTYWKRGLETSIVAHAVMNFLVIIVMGAAMVLMQLA